MDIKQKKRVVYVNLDIYPCTTGGMEIFYNNHLKEISIEKDIVLITCCEEFTNPLLQTIYIPKRIWNIRGTGRIAKLFFVAVKLIKMRRFIDYVHVPYTSNSGNYGIIFPFLSKFFNIKYILYSHGGGMGKWGKISFHKLLFKHSKRIFAVSNAMKLEYESRINCSVEVLFPIVKFHKSENSKLEVRKEMGLDSNDLIILYVGSLKTIKNPDILIDAFIKLGIDYIRSYKLKLFIVGDGPLKNSLINKTNNARVDQYVFFQGKIPNELIHNYYKISDYYVIPSQFEGAPVSLIEALYNKLPVIGSSVNGIKNIIEHERNGLLFESGNINQLASCIRFLIENKEDAECLAKQGYKFHTENLLKRSATERLKNFYL